MGGVTWSCLYQMKNGLFNKIAINFCLHCSILRHNGAKYFRWKDVPNHNSRSSKLHRCFNTLRVQFISYNHMKNLPATRTYQIKLAFTAKENFIPIIVTLKNIWPEHNSVLQSFPPYWTMVWLQGIEVCIRIHRHDNELWSSLHFCHKMPLFPVKSRLKYQTGLYRCSVPWSYLLILWWYLVY